MVIEYMSLTDEISYAFHCIVENIDLISLTVQENGSKEELIKEIKDLVAFVRNTEKEILESIGAVKRGGPNESR